MRNNNFVEEIKEKNKFKKQPVLSKKNMFKFENMNRQDRSIYMQEINLQDININTIDIKQFKKINKETQKMILRDLIDKYNTNTEIAKHTKMSRGAISKLRKELEFEPSKFGNYTYHPTKAEIAEMKQKQEVNKKEPINVVEIKICLENCNGNAVQKKLESLALFLEENKKYDINLVIKEKTE